jgi:hypothetical protein
MRLSGILRAIGLVLLSADIATTRQGDKLPLTRSAFASPVTARQSQASSSSVDRAEELVHEHQFSKRNSQLTIAKPHRCHSGPIIFAHSSRTV